MKYLVLLFSLTFLVACGGSGGSDSAAPSSPEQSPAELVEGMYYLTDFEGDVEDGVYIYDGNVFLLDKDTHYRFIVNTTLTNGSYESFVLDFEKGTNRVRVSGASPSYIGGIVNEDISDGASLNIISDDRVEVVLGDYKYTLQAQHQTSDESTDEFYFIQAFYSPLNWSVDYVEYSTGFLTIAVNNGCIYTTHQTVRVRGILYGENFVSNCDVYHEYFNSILIDNGYGTYDTAWWYAI